MPSKPRPAPVLPTVDQAAPPPLQGLAPIISPQTKLIVLGSFPGVASLVEQQYYAHPRNHFWPILSVLWGLEGDVALQRRPYAERIAEAQRRGLGIWDVYASCLREGSLDSDIEQAELNPLHHLKVWAPGLQAIAHNGGESARHMKITQALGLPVVKLPSTSPANASWSFERKVAAWRDVFEQVALA
ncbi:MAG: DNA-deoxyinosine glycosylase [Pseudomonadota bacterium]